MANIYDNPNHLLIGLGGTGGKILKEFKLRLFREYDKKAREALIPAIEILYVDSTREMMNDDDETWRVHGENAMFDNSEFVNIKPHASGISEILNNVQAHPGLKYIVRNAAAIQKTLGEIGEAAGQMRRAGRIMFANSASTFFNMVRAKHTNLIRRTKKNSLHIHIFTGLAGGTGSGAIVDAISILKMNFPDAALDVYAMVPEPNKPDARIDKGRYYPNGYAALRELNGLNIAEFLPSNVITGEEHVKLNHDPLSQFNLVLYTNANETGVEYEAFKELPKLIADTIYFRLFLPNNPETQKFFRAISCENGAKFQVEYNTKSKDKERARTKDISTFGIKRIIYPESRIEEHMSYTISQKILWQMQFNNFKEEGEGYVNEPIKKDYSEWTKDEGKLRECKLDDSHLTLNERILETDKKFQTFDSFWSDQTNFYSYKEAKNYDKHPLHFMEVFVEDKYKKDFRLGQGVEDYFIGKSADRVIRDQSETIVDAIERNLYTGWYEGKYSMSDLMGICEEILQYIKKRLEKIESDKAECDEQIDLFNQDKEDNNEEFNHAGLIRMMFGKLPKIYSEHQVILKDLYVAKTRREALGFQGKLLLRLKGDFENFKSEINKFVGVLSKTQEKLEAAIAERTNAIDKITVGDIDYNKVNIEVSEDDKMVEFEEKLSRDRSKMDNLASILRKKLVGEQAFAHFGDLAFRINPRTTVKDIADRELIGQIVAYHDMDDKFSHDRIIGINVLKQLQKMIGDNPDNMKKFASEVIDHCSVLLKQDAIEVNSLLKNNEDMYPIQYPAAMNNKCVCICLPNPEGDDNLKGFAKDLENCLRSQLGSNAAGSDICVDYSSQSKNEITIVQVRSLFPIRTISHLKLMKREYDNMVNNVNPIERVQNRILLHSEGDGSELPSLEGEGEGPKGDERLSYYFLAVAIGKIVMLEPPVEEEKGWYYTTLDDFGSPVSTLISTNFIGIETSEELTSEVQSALTDDVDTFLKGIKDLKSAECEQYKATIDSIMRDYVARETEGPKSSIYKKYGNAAKSAKEKFIK